MEFATKKLIETDEKNYLPVFRRFPLVIERGEGSRIWDIEGNEYIDALAGIAVNSLGHCHPEVVEAIRHQAGKLMHISNFYLSEPQAGLSEMLCRLSGLDRVFLTNSGAEAVEGAIKIARKHSHSRGGGGTVISFTGSFHGRTLATLAATGKKEMQEGFEPVPAGFIQTEFNNIEALEEAVSPDTAAIIIEPVQGEGGVNVAGHDFLSKVRKLCSEKGIVLIFDEIQCGLGRTGKIFAKDHFGVQPDIMVLAKALGGGFPIGAILATEKVGQSLNPGDHGTTFGGNPLASAASLATLRVIEKEGLAEKAAEKGNWLMQKILDMEEPSMIEVRGLGLMIGVEFRFNTKPLVEEMLHRGVLANSTAGRVLRLVPPLNISYEDLETVIETLKESLKNIKKNA